MSTPTESAVTIPPPGAYRLDPASSTISFKTRAMFGLLPVKGTFNVTAGTLVVADEVSTSTLTATAGANSFNTGNDKRDHHVTSQDFLHADAHPDLTYQSTSVTESAGRWVLHGDLVARGTAAPVDLTVVSAETRGNTVTVEATGSVDRYAHGITSGKGMAGRRLQLTVTAVATRD